MSRQCPICLGEGWNLKIRKDGTKVLRRCWRCLGSGRIGNGRIVG